MQNYTCAHPRIATMHAPIHAAMHVLMHKPMHALYMHVPMHASTCMAVRMDVHMNHAILSLFLRTQT